MPRSDLGQLISFSVDQSADHTYTKYAWIRAKKNDTIAKIAGRRAHPEMAHQILSLNPSVRDVHGHRLRHLFQKLKAGTLLRVPGVLKEGPVVHVLADDPPPIVKDGYAMYDVVNVPGRRGISRFTGYNPYSLDVPIQWENWKNGDGKQVEADIAAIEAMAGVGNYQGARNGAPDVIRVSVTDNWGNVVPLIAPPFQWTPSNPIGPEWRITGLSWDASPSRTKRRTFATGQDPGGRRVRQKAVITITEFTPISVVERSAAVRSVQRNTSNVKKAKSSR